MSARNPAEPGDHQAAFSRGKHVKQGHRAHRERRRHGAALRPMQAIAGGIQRRGGRDRPADEMGAIIEDQPDVIRREHHPDAVPRAHACRRCS